jgi:3-hydroxyisobutyrate dehydrogenase-like beta-hydroxyacid dehydrogenase
MAAERLIVAAGATYVDVAVMSPVYPGRHRTPLLVSGAASGDAAQRLSNFGMKARAVGDKVGQASSIKMLRSVMIKGFEALTAECVLAARRAGVEDAVIASLQASDPGVDWLKRSAYNLERMMVHGKRRASEMREVAATLRELGLPDRMAVATAEWQAQIGDLDVVTEDDSLDARADSILEYFAR